MKALKLFIIKYMLYIYTKMIKENYDDLIIFKTKALPFAKFLVFLCSVYIWTISILLFPIFIVSMYIEEYIKQLDISFENFEIGKSK